MRTYKHLIWLIFLTLLGCTPVQPAQPQDAQEARSDEHQGYAYQVESAVLEQVSVSPPGSGAGEVRIVGGDEAALREFIQRWFGSIYPGAPEGDTLIQLGSLPEKMPVELPLPEGARVVASVQEPFDYLQVILDIDLAPQEISEFYTRSLTAAGWQAAPEWPHASGFVAAGDFGERYCLGESEAYLEVWAQAVAERPTDVRLHLHAPADIYQCQETGPDNRDPVMERIPALEAPAGVQMTGGGAGSSSEGSGYTSTDLKTSLSAEALLAHYNGQLAKAGWQLSEQGATEVVSWSAWRLTDERGDEWAGTLIVMDTRHTPDRRFALFMVEKGQ